MLAQMRQNCVLLGNAALLLLALHHACPTSAFVVPGLHGGFGAHPAVRLAKLPHASASVSRRKTGNVLKLQATDEVTQQEKMERAKKMIEQVRGGAASRLDQKIDEIKNPEAAASVSGTNSSSDRDTESREEKMARAKAMID